MPGSLYLFTSRYRHGQHNLPFQWENIRASNFYWKSLLQCCHLTPVPAQYWDGDYAEFQPQCMYYGCLYFHLKATISSHIHFPITCLAFASDIAYQHHQEKKYLTIISWSILIFPSQIWQHSPFLFHILHNINHPHPPRFKNYLKTNSKKCTI